MSQLNCLNRMKALYFADLGSGLLFRPWAIAGTLLYPPFWTKCGSPEHSLPCPAWGGALPAQGGGPLVQGHVAGKAKPRLESCHSELCPCTNSTVTSVAPALLEPTTVCAFIPAENVSWIPTGAFWGSFVTQAVAHTLSEEVDMRLICPDACNLTPGSSRGCDFSTG